MLVEAEKEVSVSNILVNIILLLLISIRLKIVFTEIFESETSFSAASNITGFKIEVAKVNAEKRLAYDIAEKIRIEILILEKDLLN